MALFVKNHSSDQIMILGRWKSKAFLYYIRPQVLAWTDLFSKDMISFDNFHKLCNTSERAGAKRGTETKTVEYTSIPDLATEFEY